MPVGGSCPYGYMNCIVDARIYGAPSCSTPLWDPPASRPVSHLIRSAHLEIDLGFRCFVPHLRQVSPPTESIGPMHCPQYIRGGIGCPTICSPAIDSIGFGSVILLAFVVSGHLGGRIAPPAPYPFPFLSLSLFPSGTQLPFFGRWSARFVPLRQGATAIGAQ